MSQSKSAETVDARDSTRPQFNFDNTFARSLAGFFVSCQAEPAVAPKLLQFNHALAEELGLEPVALDSEAGLAIFSGSSLFKISLRSRSIYPFCQF